MPPPEEIDPKNPPESLVVISMGTDTTDLVITDGTHLWQRNIPIGGNHFTKQLSRELKLTYAKAEHLKRNARKAEDPKTIFQAMRPVFNDLVTELQRSLSYFQGVHKRARLGRVLMFGNASKLPGLRQFLATSLSTEIGKINGYERLGGSSITSSKQFEENNLSYAVCYGLCLQALGRAKLKTNLIPPEFLTERIIRAKKPWALAGVGALLLGCSINYFFNYMGLNEVHPKTEIAGETWNSAKERAQSVVSLVNDLKEKDKAKVLELEKIRQVQQEIAGSNDGRLLWPELYSALCQALPKDPRITEGVPVDPKLVPYAGRQQIYIDSIETVYETNLKDWLTADIKRRYVDFVVFEQRGALPEDQPAGADGSDASAETTGDGTAGDASTGDAAAAEPAAQPATPANNNAAADGEKLKTPEEIEKEMKLEGPGWVIQIKGHHYYNDQAARDTGTGGGIYVRTTLLHNLLAERNIIRLPVPADLRAEFGISDTEMDYRFSQLGVLYPVLTQDPVPNYANTILNPDHPSYSSNSRPTGGMAGMAGGSSMMGIASGPGGSSGPGGGAASGSGASGSGTSTAPVETDEPISFAAPRYDFTIQFAWQPVTHRERLQRRMEYLARQEKEQANNPPANPQP
ncbi:MAG: pilus assembly protein PilM [Pirellulaceae bacterium]